MEGSAVLRPISANPSVFRGRTQAQRGKETCPRPQTKLSSGLARPIPALPVSCDARRENPGPPGSQAKGEGKEAAWGSHMLSGGLGGVELPFCLHSSQ